MKKNVADVRWVTDDSENDIRLGSDDVRGIGKAGPHVEKWLGLGDSAVEDGDSIAGLE